jgi:hypothetical protein
MMTPESKRKPCGCVVHIVQEGSRLHVPYWDMEGRHCSEPECEYNCRHGVVALAAEEKP